MVTSQKPALILVHGAWHVPQIYEPFTRRLQAAGFDVVCPLLPSCNSDLQPASDLFSDIEVVRNVITSLTEQARPVIVILHSYGGAVGTQAVKGLSSSERSAQGLRGGVEHLVYMCAFMLQPGESVGSASLPRPIPEPVESDETPTTFLCQPPIQLFHADVDKDLAMKSEKLLVRQSASAMTDTIEYPAWANIPTTYFKCTEDQVLLLDWQERQIEAVEKTGTSVEVVTFKSSHSPYLSISQEIVDEVEKIATRYAW